MKKWIVFFCTIFLFFGLVIWASSRFQSNWTCPLCVKVDDVIYITGGVKAEMEPSNEDIKGYIQSAVAASKMPEDNNQSNFNACIGQPYAVVNGQFLLYYNGQWNKCTVYE